MTTAQFQAITPNLSCHHLKKADRNVLDPEISIMEMPELIPHPSSSPNNGGGIDIGDENTSPTTVAIGINHGWQTYFIHVRLGLPSTELEGWATCNGQHDPMGTSEQRQKPLDAIESLGWRSCWKVYAQHGVEEDNIWKTRRDMKWLHHLYLYTYMICSGGTGVVTAPSSRNTAANIKTKSTTNTPKPPIPGLHVAVRMPATYLEFDDVLSSFLTQHKLSTSAIADYYIYKVVDTAHCIYTTEDILQTNESKAFSSRYWEVPCISPLMPNEPGIVFAIVVKFNEHELHPQRCAGYYQRKYKEYVLQTKYGYDSEEEDEQKREESPTPELDPIFKTGVVAIFVHSSAKTGLSHIMTEHSWPEFKDPTKPDYTKCAMYQERQEKAYIKPPLQVFQEKLALPSSFSNTLMVLSNAGMLRDQGSLKAVYHPVLPQWLIGFNESTDKMQELARYCWTPVSLAL
jgi:hypothetical protein